MCWWISKVDIWCGSPYPAKHLDDLSACRVRKCNDLSHQKYDFFFKPLKLECYLHIFFVDLANLASKKKTTQYHAKKNIPWMLKNFPHHAVVKVFSVLCLVPKMSMFLAPFFLSNSAPWTFILMWSHALTHAMLQKTNQQKTLFNDITPPPELKVFFDIWHDTIKILPWEDEKKQLSELSKFNLSILNLFTYLA